MRAHRNLLPISPHKHWLNGHRLWGLYSVKKNTCRPTFSTFPEATMHKLRRKSHSSDCSYGYFHWPTWGSLRKLLRLGEVVGCAGRLTADSKLEDSVPGLSDQASGIFCSVSIFWCASLLILFRNFP